MTYKEYQKLHWFMRWLCRYTPMDRINWKQGIYWRWVKIRQRTPLITLLQLSFWRTVREDCKAGCKTCGCGKTWWRYRIMPAIFGDKRFGGGC